MICGVGGKSGWDLVLLWPWRRPATVALIRSLAWEIPYAEGAGLKSKKKKKIVKNFKFCVVNSFNLLFMYSGASHLV